MAAFVQERVGIKEFGRDVMVADSPQARLMYYLDCVAVVIQLNDPNLRKLKDYRNYNSLTDREVDALLALVILFSPDELIGKVFFPSEDCDGYSNQFYELNAVSHMLAVSDNILIGGERKRVAKVMFFQRWWMEYNYLTPIRSFEGRLQRMVRGLPGRAPSPPRELPPPRPSPAPAARREESSCNIS